MPDVLRFPDEAETIRRDAEAFRRLSSTARFQAILDLISAGQRLMGDSPHRDFAERQRAAEEEEWQRCQKELFARHGR